MKHIFTILLSVIIFSCSKQQYEKISTLYINELKIETIKQNDSIFILQKDVNTGEICSKEFISYKPGNDYELWPIIIDGVLAFLTLLTLGAAICSIKESKKQHKENLTNNIRPEISASLNKKLKIDFFPVALIKMKEFEESFFSQKITKEEDKPTIKGLSNIFQEAKKNEDTVRFYEAKQVPINETKQSPTEETEQNTPDETKQSSTEERRRSATPLIITNTGRGTAVNINVEITKFTIESIKPLKNKIIKENINNPLIIENAIVLAGGNTEHIFKGDVCDIIYDQLHKEKISEFKLTLDVTITYTDIDNKKYKTTQYLKLEVTTRDDYKDKREATAITSNRIIKISETV